MKTTLGVFLKGAVFLLFVVGIFFESHGQSGSATVNGTPFTATGFEATSQQGAPYTGLYIKLTTSVGDIVFFAENFGACGDGVIDCTNSPFRFGLSGKGQSPENANAFIYPTASADVTNDDVYHALAGGSLNVTWKFPFPNPTTVSGTFSFTAKNARSSLSFPVTGSFANIPLTKYTPPDGKCISTGSSLLVGASGNSLTIFYDKDGKLIYFGTDIEKSYFFYSGTKPTIRWRKFSELNTGSVAEVFLSQDRFVMQGKNVTRVYYYESDPDQLDFGGTVPTPLRYRNYDYNGDGQIISVDEKDWVSASTLSRNEYTYNSDGNVVSAIRSITGTSGLYSATTFSWYDSNPNWRKDLADKANMNFLELGDKPNRGALFSKNNNTLSQTTIFNPGPNTAKITENELVTTNNVGTATWVVYSYTEQNSSGTVLFSGGYQYFPANVCNTPQGGLPAAPQATVATNLSSTQFTANWLPSANAFAYVIDVSADDFATFIAGYQGRPIGGRTAITGDFIPDLSIQVQGLQAATTYKYRVRANNANGILSASSNVVQVTTKPAGSAPSSPQAVDATFVSANSFIANWISIAGASGYQLDVSADDFATFLAGYNSKSITSTFEVLNGLTANTTYKYRVRAVSANGISENSNVVSVSTAAAPVVPGAPVATMASNILSVAFTANWNAVAGAIGYRLDVSADNFVTFVAGFNDKTVSSNSDVVTGLAPSTAYKYRVRAVNGNGTSLNSNVIDVTTTGFVACTGGVLDGALTIPTAAYQTTTFASAGRYKTFTAVQGTSYNFSFCSNGGGANYNTELSILNDAGLPMANGYNNDFCGTRSDLVWQAPSSGTFRVLVTAFNCVNTGGSSATLAYATVLPLAPPTAPNGLQASFISNTGFQLNWNGIARVRNFRIDVSTDNFATFVTGWQNAAADFQSPPAERVWWNVLGLNPSTTYQIRIRAVNELGTSPNSDVIQVTTVAHPAMVSANQSVTSFGASGSNETFVNGLATDSEGNVYAVGKFGGTLTLGATTLTSLGGADVFFAKYNPAGQVQWAKSIGGVGVDEGWQIAVDATGVYISGVFDETVDFNPDAGTNTISTRGAGTNPRLAAFDDGFIAKYNVASGAYVWAQGLGDAWADWNTAGLAIDNNNGVFLTGFFTGTNDFDPGAGTVNLTSLGGADIFITRFTKDNGLLSWAVGFGSTGSDFGTALVSDGTSLFAAGHFSNTTDLDPGVGTVNANGAGVYFSRFVSVSGALTFAKSIAKSGDFLEANALAKDNTHIYLAGAFRGTVDADPDAGVASISGAGGFVAKYTMSNGSFAWANGLISNAYLAPTRVIADPAGVYVGGNFAWLADFDPGPAEANRAGAFGDIFVARYNNANGAFQWAKNIGGGGFDQMRGSMALANDGLYVGGFFAGTVNFDPYTNVLNRTAAGAFDGFIAKYQSVSPTAPSAPVLLPASFVSNTGFLLRWNGIADINTYRIDVATDNTFNTRTFNNLEARVTPSTGVLEWNFFNIPAATTYFIRVRAEAAGGLISANSNVITLTTESHPIEQSNNLWTSTFGSTGNEQSTAVTTDASGNVYGVGYFSGPITIGSTNLSNVGGQDAFFAKYNSSGVVQWAKSLGSAQNEEIWAAATDATGLYVYGFLTSPGLDVDPNAGVTTLTGTGTTFNAFVAKYSLADGSLIWAIPLGDVSVITGNPLVSDGTNVYVTGGFANTVDFDPGAGVQNRSSAGGEDAFIARYSATNGAFGWVNTFGGTGLDRGYSFVLSGGALFVSGIFSQGADLDTGAGTNIPAAGGAFFSRFNPVDGAHTWSKAVLGDVFGFGLAADASNVYLVGSFSATVDFDPDAGSQPLNSNNPLTDDGFIAKYTQATGAYVFAKSLPTSFAVLPRKVVSNANGLFVAGSSTWAADFDPNFSEANRTSFNQDAFLASYTFDGSFVFAKTFGASGVEAIRGGLWLASDGVYISGSYQNTVNFDAYSGSVSRVSNGGVDAFLAKYTIQPTAPATPTANAATNITSNGFTANWAAVAAASSYRLDVSTSNTFSSFLTGYQDRTVNGTSFMVTGLTSSTTYYYRLRGTNVAGTSGNSSVITAITSAAPLTAPTANAASSISANAFTANWSSVGGATSYRLDVSTDNFQSFVSGFSGKDVTTTSDVVGGLTPSIAYQYRVRAVNASGSSGNSNVVSATTAVPLPAAPVALAASSISQSGFVANWNAATGATGYLIDISTDNFITFVTGYLSKTVATLSETVSGLNAGLSYQYRIRAISAGGSSTFSNVISVTTAVAAPAPPIANSASGISSTTFTTNWSSVSGATSYQLDISSDNFVTFLTGYNSKTVILNSEAVAGVLPNSNLKYRIRSVNAGGISINSNVIDVATVPSAPIATLATGVTTTSFTATWDPVVGATGYRLDVSVDNFVTFVTGFNNKTISINGDVVSGLTAATAYRYRVRTVTANGTSANSNAIDVSTLAIPPLDAPVATAATSISTTGFTANWNAVTGATGYRLDVSSDNFTTLVTGFNDKTVTATSDVVTGLTASTSYKYRVRAINVNTTSVNSNVIDVTTLALPNAPVALAATAISQTGFTANWNAVTGATGYRLDVSADNFTTFITGFNDKTVTTTSDAVTGLTASTAYKYRVRAVNANGTSVNSNVIDVTTLATPPPPDAPVAAAATAISQTGFTANWNAVTGATGYRLDVSADNFTTLVTGFSDKTVTGTNDAVTGLTISTAYKYRVRAVNANGTSVNSNVIDVTTLAKQDQTITFAALPDRTVGDAAFALTATASSGLAVSFASNSPRLTISGTQATIVSAGRVTVTASQSGNTVFNAAPAVERSFCIKPARPTITLGAPGETVVLTSSSATGNQWFRDGTLITGASANTFTVTQVGVYSVRVQIDDCQSEASTNVPVIVTGDLTTANEHTWVYPNPVKDRVWVDLQSFEKGKSVQIRLVDVLGRVIQQAEAAGGSTHELNLADQPAGTYRLVAKQSNRQLQMSLVKQ